MLKIGFFKAFDCVSWEFLDTMLSQFGFGSKWRSWLKTCWSTSSFSILLNGSPGKTFKSSRGLQQGHPLSPMVFVLAIEILTQMFLKVEEGEFFNGFQVSELSDRFPILQFADDTLLMLGGSLKKAKVVRNILVWFEACSGLRVNTNKIIIYQVNLVGDWDEIVGGVSLVHFPTLIWGFL